MAEIRQIACDAIADAFEGSGHLRGEARARARRTRAQSRSGRAPVRQSAPGVSLRQRTSWHNQNDSNVCTTTAQAGNEILAPSGISRSRAVYVKMHPKLAALKKMWKFGENKISPFRIDRIWYLLIRDRIITSSTKFTLGSDISYLQIAIVLVRASWQRWWTNGLLMLKVSFEEIAFLERHIQIDFSRGKLERCQRSLHWPGHVFSP